MKSQLEDIRDHVLDMIWYHTNHEIPEDIWRRVQDDDIFYPFRLVDIVDSIRSLRS